MKINRAHFLSEILKHSTSGENPETIINYALAYMGEELDADRSYIFEENSFGTFDNTYEWCREGVTPQIDNLKNLPYSGVIEPWYDEYKKNRNIYIEDLEDYKAVCPPMYEVLKPQDIQTLISAPLIIDGELCGFFGVDNPPVERMKDISGIISLLIYTLSIMIRFRNYYHILDASSREDALTKINNRKAFNNLEKKLDEEGFPSDFCIIALDVNGLKSVNDSQGHEAGDELLKGAADVIKDSFSKYGEVFRIGGDEFCACIYIDETSISYLLDEFLQNVDNWSGDIVKSLSISYGYARADEFDVPVFKDINGLADKRMYGNKAQYYSMSGMDRRS